MAMQAASPAATLPSAQIVGHAFVEQYYHILHQSPELVYKFYQDSSVLSRPDCDGIMTSVTTMQAINDKIQSLDYKNFKAEIKTADAQESFQGGFIVLVTGCLTGSDNVRRKFTQTFFLAPQEKGYFVLNDVFRYIEESGKLETTSAAVGGIIDTAPSAPSTSDPEPTPTPDNSVFDPAPTLESEDLQNGAEVYNLSDNEEGSGLEDEVINEPPTQSSHIETAAVVGSDTSAAQEEKKSYASIVKVTKAAAASSSAYNPTSNMRWAPTNAAQPTPVSSAKPTPEPEASVATSDNAPEISNAHEEGHSIYVRNLPLNAEVLQLEEVFRKFGPIKRGGIQVRSNKLQGFCFGFVEFELLESMQNAIKESPITIGGRNAVVEEKRTTTRVGGRGGGRYPSGRGGGGYRNVNFRGRGGDFGGGRGGGGYSRNNEYRNQGEFSSRPKGGPPTGRSSNGEGGGYRRVVDQNGGGGRFGPQGGGVNKAAA